MAEYINKVELKSEGICIGIMCSECSFNNNFKDEVCKLSRYIDELPTIDIVHCYKCKHYEKYTEHTGLCNHFVVNGERLAMEYDWFCADGERNAE